MEKYLVNVENIKEIEEKVYSITLEDGTKLENLHLNGNNFVSGEELTKDIFDNNLGVVVINDGITDFVHHNMKLVHLTKMEEEYYFYLMEIPMSEIENAKLRSDLDYVMMMTELDV